MGQSSIRQRRNSPVGLLLHLRLGQARRACQHRLPTIKATLLWIKRVLRLTLEILRKPQTTIKPTLATIRSRTTRYTTRFPNLGRILRPYDMTTDRWDMTRLPDTTTRINMNSDVFCENCRLQSSRKEYETAWQKRSVYVCRAWDYLFVYSLPGG